MPHRTPTVFLVQILLLGSIVLAAPAQAPPPPAADAQETTKPAVALEDLPWQYQLGFRSAQLTDRIALLDRVVLVPDLATWLDEIGRWQQGVQWPVLLEDDRYTPLFVRRFQYGIW